MPQRVSSLQLVPTTVITPTSLNMLRKSTSSSYISSESETDTKVQAKSKLIPSATDLGKRVVFHSSQNKKEKYGTLRLVVVQKYLLIFMYDLLLIGIGVHLNLHQVTGVVWNWMNQKGRITDQFMV